ncbi:MAG: hypothetical protein AABX11_05005 [Nanoarchaeota archaeon]
MKNTMKNIGMALLSLGIISQATIPVRGNDIFIGTRGPTEHQLDVRASYTEKKDAKGISTRTFAQNDVLKYWNTLVKRAGNELGVFGFANISAYRSVDNGKARSKGFGDLTLGMGPRGTLSLDGGKGGSLHVIGYGKAIIPTADVKTPALGNDRTDFGAGAFLTYLSPNRKFEIDGAVDYVWAGRNSRGVKGMDVLSGGLIAGGQIYDSKKLELRLAGGLNGQIRDDGAYSYGPRAVLRLTPKFQSGKKHGHFELIGDYDASAKNMPKGFGVLGQLRINF